MKRIFLALAAVFGLAGAAHATCPVVSLTGLSGKDASSSTQTLATLTQTYQYPLHVANLYNGTTYAPFVGDASCNLDVAVVGNVAVTGTFWQATQPVSAASLPLPTGAAVAPGAANGISTKSFLVANNTTSLAVDASAGSLYAVRVFNNSTTIGYAKFYNAAQGSTTCGSGTPINRVMIPASSGASLNMGAGNGVAYGTAISLCVTTGIADADATAPAASTYIVEADYK